MKSVVVIHGGDAFATYEEYFSHLEKKKLFIERLDFKDWKKNLKITLGSDFHVISPTMPNAQNAHYEEWKIWFEKLIPFLSENLVCVGHSLGGIFLAKYLSENRFPKHIQAIFLVGAPYATTEEATLGDFTLKDDFSLLTAQVSEIYLYHSTDDPVVAYADALRYAKSLPSAKLRTFSDRGHFIGDSFPELIEDIKALP